MPAASTLAIVGLAVGAVGTLAQIDAAQDAKKAQGRMAQAQRDQAAVEARKADVMNVRTLRNAVRQARVARAAVINMGANAGTLGSSGVLGGTASIIAQRNANLGFFGQMDQLNDQVTETQVRQADASADLGGAQAQSAIGGALGVVGGTIFNSTSSTKNGWKTIFDKT